MSTAPSKNDTETAGRVGRRKRKRATAAIESHFPNGLEQADPTEAVRKMAQTMLGQRLPSERDLAAMLRISRPHLRSILLHLQKEGLVEARPKSGTYVVDTGAARLRRVLLLIDSDLKLGDDPFFLSLLDSLQRSVQDAGARCLIERTNGDLDRRPALEDSAITIGLAGHSLIANQRPNDPPMVGLLLDSHARPGRRASIFQLDDQGAGSDAAKILIAAGCRDILFLGRQNIPASRERLAGVEEAAAEAGAEVRLVSCHLNYADGLRLGQELDLSGPKGKKGVITTNDWLALGLRTGLRHRQDPGERDLPIVSFDGLSVAADPSLKIMSLAVPIEEITTDAVAELQRLHGSPAAKGRVIRYPLLAPS